VPRTGGWIKHWIQDVIGAGLAITVGLGALAARPFGLWFEEWSYDLPYRLRPDVAANDMVVVSMDAASRKALAQEEDANRWNRQLHASLLDRLLGRGARMIVFTAVFSEPSPTNSSDRVFAQALRRARGRVVLAAASATGSNNGAVRPPIPELGSAAPWGLLAAPSGRDQVIRRHGSPGGPPTLAARVAQLLGKPSTNGLHSRWLNYYASDLALPEVSYDQVLRGAESPGVFKGKIVLIGSPAADSQSLPTPYTRWTGRRATRTEIEATAILNLSRREWLSRLPPMVETGILIVTGGFFGLVFMGMRRRAAVLLASGATLLIVAAAYLSFAKLQFWFPWLVVAAVQIPVAFGWAWLCEAADRQPLPHHSPSPVTTALAPASVAPATPSTSRQAVPPVPSPDSPVIPDHTLIRCIGRGAYGEVWLVRDVVGRHHAVKIVKARDFPHSAPYEREFKGIERFASISRNHPGLVQVLHIGRHDAKGYFYYIMELADDANGTASLVPDRYSPKTLGSELARRGHLPVQESVQIGLRLCSALQHLHERQSVHRDIKPSNIIFVEGRVKIADIGLVAPIAPDATDMTRLGTEGYLPPEGPGTPLADLYALGKVLYEISMGRDRWQFPELPTTIGTRPDQDELRRLHEIILTACETDPAQRYQSSAGMHAALTQLLSS
jgi:CHASE2 domain-containing sensor protein